MEKKLTIIKDKIHNDDIILLEECMPNNFYGYIYYTINLINYKRYIGCSKCHYSSQEKFKVTNNININDL